jgi:hypothetical protein
MWQLTDIQPAVFVLMVMTAGRVGDPAGAHSPASPKFRCDLAHTDEHLRRLRSSGLAAFANIEETHHESPWQCRLLRQPLVK